MWNVGIVEKVGMCSHSVTKSSVMRVNRGRHQRRVKRGRHLSTNVATRNCTTHVWTLMTKLLVVNRTQVSQKTEVGAVVCVEIEVV